MTMTTTRIVCKNVWTPPACPACGAPLEEFAADHHGIGSDLSPTTYAGSAMACRTHGTPERVYEQWEAWEYAEDPGPCPACGAQWVGRVIEHATTCAYLNTVTAWGPAGDGPPEPDPDVAARMDAAESLMTYADSLATWEAEWCGPGTAALIREARATAGELLASVGVYPPVVTRDAWPTGYTVATGRPETDPCEAGTPGCCVDHTLSPRGTDCDGW